MLASEVSFYLLSCAVQSTSTEDNQTTGALPLHFGGVFTFTARVA